MQLLDCNIRCWECSEDCDIRKTFSLPDQLFYECILDWAKTIAGYLITANLISYENCEKLLKITCVSLKLAREEYLKKKSGT